MMDSKPLISIGMPVFNGEPYIRQALDSLLAQDYENCELIISDNASTDRSRDICLEYASRDSRIRYYRNETNLGAAKNFNRLIALSSGKYFMFAADHDLWNPTFVSRCTEVLEKAPSAVLCYTRTMLIDSKDNTLGLTPDQIDTRSMSAVERYRYTMWNLNWCNMVYGVIRTDSLRKVRGFRPVISCDMAVLAELALRGEFIQIQEPLFYRRKNREDEDPETLKQRTLWYIDPRITWKSKKSYSVLYRELGWEHLRIVFRTPITHREKMKLILETMYCFSMKYNGLLYRFLPVLKFRGALRLVRGFLRSR